MAGSYDYESLYGLDPEKAEALRERYGLTGETAATGARPATGNGGAPMSIDPSWFQPPAPKPAPAELRGSHSPAPAAVTPASGLAAYAQSLRPEPQGQEAPAEPVAAQAAPPAQAPAPRAPAGPVMVSPGGWRENARTMHSQLGSPEALKSVNESLDLHRQAIAQEVDIAKQRGEAQAAYASAFASAQQRHQEQAQALEVERRKYVDDQLGKLQSLSAEANAKVDPDALWKEKGTGAQVAAALMVGLGQFAAIMSKTENTAAKMMDAAIERNIRAQEANIANKRAALNDQTNLYARNLAEFGDREKAVLATRMQMYDAAKAQLEAKVAQLGTAEAEANGKKLQASLMERYAAAQREFGDKVTVESHSQNERPVFANIGGAADPSKEKDKGDLYVPTLGGYARTKEDAQLLNKNGALRMQIASNMEQIASIIEESKALSGVPLTEDSRKLDMLQERVEGLINDTLRKSNVQSGMGAMSEGDKKVAEIASNLQNIRLRLVRNSTLDNQVKNIRFGVERVRQDHRMDGEAFGIRKGQETYREGQSGPVPTQVLDGRNAPLSKRTTSVDDLITPPAGNPKR